MGQAAIKAPTPAVVPNVASPPSKAAEPSVTPTAIEPGLSGGSSIVPSTRARMERSFGRSFEDVRVHTDARASSFATEQRAEAVTTGRDIAFGPSKYRPGTEGGDRLLAHELAHVVQQGGTSRGAVQTKSEVSTPNEPAELQADAAASRVVAGRPAGIVEGGFAWSTRNRLMRKALSGAGSMGPSVPVPISGDAAAAAGTAEAEVGGAPPRRKRRRAEAEIAEGGTAAKDAEGAPQAEGAAAPRPVESAERETEAEAQAEPEERRRAPSDRTDREIAAEEPGREHAEAEMGVREHAEAEMGVREDGGRARPRSLAARLVARAQRAKDAEGTETAKDGDVARKGGTLEGKVVKGVAPEGKAAKGATVEGTEGKGVAPEGEAAKGATVEGTEGKGVAPEGEAAKDEAIAGARDQAKGIEGKQAKAEPTAAGSGQAQAGGGVALGSAGPGKMPAAPTEAAKAAAPAREAGPVPAGEPAAGETKAKGGPSGDAAKTIEDAVGGATEGSSPAAAREPAAGGGGGGAGGGGGGGDAGGGEGGAEAEAIEEELANEQPEEEKAAEAEQDADASEGGGEAEPEPAEEPAPELEPPASAAEADVGGGADASPDAGASASAAEQKMEAEQAPALAKAEQRAKEDEAAEVGPEEEPASSPDAAGGEEAQLSPAEQSAAVGAVSQDVGGGGAGGGGGGGGGAVPDKPAPQAPDVSGREPKAALGSLQGLAPMAIKGALGGVSSSVSKTIGDRSQALAASPPTRAASTGMPGKQGSTPVELEGGGEKEKAEKVAEGAEVATPEPEPVPEAPPAAVETVAAPTTSGGGEGEMSEADASRMGAAIDGMPTSDPEVETTAGPPPTVALEGSADPAQVTSQRAKMDESIAAAHEEGQADAREPLGEDEIAPEATDETLAAKVPGTAGGGGGEAGGGGGGGGAEEEATSIIAAEKSQGEIDAAVAEGQGDMAAEEAKEAESSEAERQSTDEEMARAESQAEADQQAEKATAKKKALKQRGEWSESQQAAVDKSSTDADTKEAEAEEKVETEKTNADADAEQEIDAGEQKAAKEKRDGEAKAEQEKQKAKGESSGFFGWLASKAKAFFDKVKSAIKSAMKALREAVKAAIEAAKKAAVALIEAARKAIVAAIRLAGEALIAISDVALAAFPGLKAKFQAAVRQTVADAEDAVNKLADGLKKAVTALLDALGEFLDKALGLLEKALLAAVDAVAKVVDAAIKAAEAVAQALGTFVVLIKDVAAGPGQWIANLGAAVVDGIRNHLVKAMKTAISGWFKSKIEEVLGLPIELMKALFKGGFDLGKIGKMAWEALKTAVPAILIALLIEKLVAMIVPAAGAVMAIIEGLQAAWGTVSRIIAAIGAFVAFLKAVKGGGAGPQFANVVASAAVVVIDFVANWLLRKLIKPAKKVGGKLAAIAKKIIAKIKKGLKKVGKALKKLGKKLKKGLKKLGKNKGKKGKDKGKGKDKDKTRDDKKKKKIERAQRELPGKFKALLAKKPGRVRLWLQMLGWKISYGLSKLSLSGKGHIKADAVINPPIKIGDAWEYSDADVIKIIDMVARKLLKEAPRIKPGDDGVIDIPAGTKTGAGAKSLQDNTTVTSGASGGEKQGIQSYPNPKKPEEQRIKALGAESGSEYKELQNKLLGVEIGPLLLTLEKGGSLPDTLTAEQKRAARELWGLWFVKEPTHPRSTATKTGRVTYSRRHKRDLVYSHMISQMSGSGGLSTAEAIGVHPASFGGAQTGAREAGEELRKTPKGESLPGDRQTDPKGGKGDKFRNETRNERLRRERATIEMWFKTHKHLLPVQADKPPLEDLADIIYNEIQRRMTE